MTTIPPVVLFRVPIDRLSMEQTVEEIGRLVADGRTTGRTHQVCTVNVDFVVNAFDDPVLERILADADLSIGDGMPLVWMARMIDLPLPSRVTGVDLVSSLAARSARSGWRIHIFGGSDGVAGRAAELLRTRSPGSLITGEDGPRISDPRAVDPAVVDALRAIDADVLCVALGNPKQEHFIDAYREQLGCPVLIGIGGTPDMLVGVRRRAPRWMQRVGLEWVFRAVQEPRRLGRRYARDIFVFLPRAARFVAHGRRRRTDADLPDVIVADGAIAVDFSGVEAITPESLGRLAALAQQAAHDGVTLRLASVGPSLRDQLERLAPPRVTDAIQHR